MTAPATTTPEHKFTGIPCCILAGGLSRRMGGGDKSLLPIGERSMLEHVLHRLAPQTSKIILNANGDAARFAAFDLPVVADPVPGFAGPLAGVLAGLLYTRQHFPAVRHVVSVAADTPFFPADLVSRLSEAAESTDRKIILAQSGDKLHPVFGLWPVSLTNALEDWLRAGKSSKVLDFVDCHDNAATMFNPDATTGTDPFFNINRPDDLATAQALLRKGSQDKKGPR